MSLLVLQQISDEVNNEGYYSVIADEKNDLSKQEVLSLSLCYIYDGAVCEEFIGVLYPLLCSQTKSCSSRFSKFSTVDRRYSVVAASCFCFSK